MKLFKLLPLMLLSAFILSACGDDEPQEETQSLTISSSLNYISSLDKTTGTIAVLPGADYGILAFPERNMVELYVNNLQYDPNETAITFAIPAIRMNVTQGGWKYDGSETFTVQADNRTATVSNLKVDFVLRSDGAQNLVYIYFVLDGRYELTTFFVNNFFIGTTSSTDLTDPANAPFFTQQSQYLVIIDKKTMTAEVQIAYPKFVEAMPAERVGTMKFQNIPMSFTGDGMTFRINELIPLAGNAPFPNYKITNLWGTIHAGKSLSLTFDCEAFNRKVTVDATAY